MDELVVESQSRSRAAGKQIARQRSLISRTLGQAGGYLDAREIYDPARQHDPRLSLATVYRTLKALRAAGVVRELHLAGPFVVAWSKIGVKREEIVVWGIWLAAQ